jgi:hypothetical protein
VVVQSRAVCRAFIFNLFEFELLVLTAIVAAQFAQLLPTVQQAGETTGSAQSNDKLKQLSPALRCNDDVAVGWFPFDVTEGNIRRTTGLVRNHTCLTRISANSLAVSADVQTISRPMLQPMHHSTGPFGRPTHEPS